MPQLNEVVTFIPTRDPSQAKSFYEGTLGLRFVRDDQFALVFDIAGTMLRIARAPDFTPAPFTILGWEVKDIRKTALELKERAVKFEIFEGFGQDQLGIWTAPGGHQVAWFKDPDGNLLSISQHVATA
jgi:catechol 2,3-dioxygenase-like lactoylglutathione lyase family enzyme